MSCSFLIELQDVCFHYSKRPDFALRVPAFCTLPGKCMALVGPNGSGKTTLGKLAAGILRPDSGKVLHDGRDIREMKLGQIGAQVGYLFQEPSRQIFAPTVLEELCFPMALRGIKMPEQSARGILEKFGLLPLERSATYTLSRGEKQRLAMAAMMVMQPKFMILDEPTTGLDEENREVLEITLKRLMAEGVGLLLISHDMEFVSELADMAARMEGGRVVGE